MDEDRKLKLDNFALQRWIRGDVFLNRESKLILFVLSTYRNAVDLECCPSQTRLGKDLGWSARTVIKKIQGLEQSRYIITVRRGPKRAKNVYFTSDFLHALQISKQEGFRGDRGAILRANRKRFVSL